jgi:hypothetical protein
MEEKNIEIRSEKVRSIIGKMPSVLIRYGISIIVTILVLIVAGSFFFRFTPAYTAAAQVNITNSDTIITIEIPANQKQFVHIGDISMVSLENITDPELKNLYVTINHIDSVMHVNQSGACYYAYCNISEGYPINKAIETEGFILAQAKIFKAEISLFDYIVEKIVRAS